MVRMTRTPSHPAFRASLVAIGAGLLIAWLGCRYWAGPLPLGTTNDVRAAGVATRNWAGPIDRPGLPNLHKVSDDLYRGAQPTAEGIAELERLGVKTVVNLREFDTDRELLAASDLAYEHIPMTPWHVEERDVARFLHLVTNDENQPLFVHCRRGADRTGMSLAVYRVVVQGWSKDEAIAEMTQGGFRFHSGWKNLVRYVRDLDVPDLRRRAGIHSDSD
jgi:protein tyrosine/serine phosphatase